jgi:transcriptional regulator with XRE-family HTH domain
MQDRTPPDHGSAPSPTLARAEAHTRAARFGRAIRELRARRDLSQEELGFRSRLHRNYVGAIERGKINPTFRVLLTLERGLSMPLSEIVETYKRHRAVGAVQLRAAPAPARPCPDR